MTRPYQTAPSIVMHVLYRRLTLHTSFSLYIYIVIIIKNKKMQEEIKELAGSVVRLSGPYIYMRLGQWMCTYIFDQSAHKMKHAPPFEHSL